MDYSQAAAEFRKLKAQYDAGVLSEADFKARLQDLMVQDEQGRWWMIGAETGQWYVHNGGKWERGEPPIPQENLAAELAAPDAPAPPPQKPDAVETPPKARPSIPWLRVGAGVVVAAVIIEVLAQLAGHPQPTPTASPTAALASTTSPAPTPTESSTSSLIPTAAPTDTLRPPSTATQPPSATPTSALAPSATPTAPPSFTVASASVNVRSGPGTVYPAIGALRAGQTFIVRGRSAAGDWWQFDYDGRQGWVSNDVVRASAEAPSVQVAPAPPTPGLRIGSTWISPVDGMVQVYVPAGEFLMGFVNSDSEAGNAEKPQHKVTLDAFWIDRTEVTNAMFAKFVTASGYKTNAEKARKGYVYNPTSKSWKETAGADWQHPRGTGSDLAGLGQHPTVLVSWNDAAAYCAWTGRRLPTEAEWEKAARGMDGRKFPWGNQDAAGNLLNFADRNLEVDWADKNVDDGYQFTAPVGSYPKGVSPYGALDMAGDVWEWVADWYDEGYYASAPAQNPKGPETGQYRVLRGGSWDDRQGFVRAAVRGSVELDNGSDNVGFRCARSD
jgi:formylglycine-generating enzyme required for sulfatase activity